MEQLVSEYVAGRRKISADVGEIEEDIGLQEKIYRFEVSLKAILYST